MVQTDTIFFIRELVFRNEQQGTLIGEAWRTIDIENSPYWARIKAREHERLTGIETKVIEHTYEVK